MIDLALIIEILASTTLVVAPAVLLNRLIAGADGPALADIFKIPLDPPLPRGVQEEEPVRWRLDRLERRPVSADSVGADCQPRGCPASPRGARAAMG